MTRQELLDKGFTEEQATIYLNDFHTLNNEKKELENKVAGFSNQQKELEDVKAQLDAINKEKMTKEELLAEKEKIAEENLRKSAIILNKAEVKTILAGTNIGDDVIDSIVSNDRDKSIATANALLQTINTTKETVEKQTRESITNTNVKPNPGNVDPNKDVTQVSSRKEFMNLSHEEKIKFKNEHEEEYNKIMGK